MANFFFSFWKNPPIKTRITNEDFLKCSLQLVRGEPCAHTSSPQCSLPRSCMRAWQASVISKAMCLALSLHAGSWLCVSWPLEAGDFTRKGVRVLQVTNTITYRRTNNWLHIYMHREKWTFKHTLPSYEQMCIIMLLTLPLRWPFHAGSRSTRSVSSSLHIYTDRIYIFIHNIHLHAAHT